MLETLLRRYHASLQLAKEVVLELAIVSSARSKVGTALGRLKIAVDAMSWTEPACVSYSSFISNVPTYKHPAR
jgi:hypothetical protein